MFKISRFDPQIVTNCMEKLISAYLLKGATTNQNQWRVYGMKKMLLLCFETFNGPCNSTPNVLSGPK